MPGQVNREYIGKWSSMSEHEMPKKAEPLPPKFYAEIRDGVCVGVKQVRVAINDADHILIPAFNDDYMGRTFADNIWGDKPVAQYRVYSWSEFLNALHDNGRGRAVHAEKRKASNTGYDLEMFFELARDSGRVDFNNAFNRKVLDSLVTAQIFSRGVADTFMAAQ